MYTLYCPQFKTPSFSNGDSKEWNRNIDQISKWQEEFGFESGIKDLFYSLLQNGNCITVVKERIDAVSIVLKIKKYNFIIEEK